MPLSTPHHELTRAQLATAICKAAHVFSRERSMCSRPLECATPAHCDSPSREDHHAPRSIAVSVSTFPRRSSYGESSSHCGGMAASARARDAEALQRSERGVARRGRGEQDQQQVRVNKARVAPSSPRCLSGRRPRSSPVPCVASIGARARPFNDDAAQRPSEGGPRRVWAGQRRRESDLGMLRSTSGGRAVERGAMHQGQGGASSGPLASRERPLAQRRYTRACVERRNRR